MADVKAQTDKKLKELKDAGANKALLDDTKKWLDALPKQSTSAKK